MWEMEEEMEDSWSLIAVVNECARKSQLRALDNEGTLNTTTNNNVNSFQNPLFSDQTDASIYTNSVENPPLSNQFDASNSNPSQNQIDPSYTNSVENNPPFSVENPAFSNQFDASNCNPSQNPLFSAQIDASSSNSMQNPSLLFPDKFGPNNRNNSGCDHHFMNLYQHFTVPPTINPNLGVIEPLQDFKEVKDTPDNANNNMLVLQTGMQQLQPAVNHLFLPMHSSQNNPADFDYHGTPRRRRCENRSVYRLSVDELARNDKWAWRKYGQKPIKGSPYPRNYYKCSSMKGCMAKKQVERSPIDPETYVVTYTGQHHHPCPIYRNNGGPRLKVSGSNNPDQGLETGSPTNTMATHMSAGQSGSGFGPGENVVNLDGGEQGDEDRGAIAANVVVIAAAAAADADADVDVDVGVVGAGDSEEGSNDQIPIPNPMDINNASKYDYRYEYGYGYGYEIENVGYDLDVNIGGQENGTCGDYNIWDNEMIKYQFLFW